MTLLAGQKLDSFIKATLLASHGPEAVQDFYARLHDYENERNAVTAKKLDPKEIDALIEAAGLFNVMTVFDSAIEIRSYEQRPDGEWYDGYSALAALIAYATVHHPSSDRPGET